jgi:anaerobic selenocysteine-containing dehydrogenase
MIHEIDRRGGFDAQVIARHGKHVEGLREFVARYPAERVAAVTGIDATVIRTLAREFSAASAASTYMATGVNQGRQGTLAYWLLNMLSFVTGNLGRPGGNYYAKGFSSTTAASDPSKSTHFDTPFGPMRHVFGALPGSLLADFIETGHDPIRALIVLSGDPLLSMPGEERLRRAFKGLELVICVDLYRNATGELADYVLPAADWLEREDITHTSNGVQPKPYVQYADAVTAPRGERRDDWWIIARIEQELGLPSMLDHSPPLYRESMQSMLRDADLSIEKLRALPHHTVVLPQPPRETFYQDLVLGADRKVDCCPAAFTEALARCEAIFRELECEDSRQLKIISLRTNYMHNGNLANMEALKRSRHSDNPLHMHPEDARRRGLSEGDTARLFNTHGSVLTRVTLDDTLRPGVVALTHGYGHYRRAPGMSRASASCGANVNNLLPTGPGTYEPLSNMSHMNGVPVEVEKEGAHAANSASPRARGAR